MPIIIKYKHLIQNLFYRKYMFKSLKLFPVLLSDNGKTKIVKLNRRVSDLN